jgi:hypothetical protein
MPSFLRIKNIYKLTSPPKRSKIRLGKRGSKMKKELLYAVVLVLLISAVSARSYSYGNFPTYSYSGGYGSGFGYSLGGASSWIDYNIGPYFTFLLGGNEEFLFERILFFFIVLSIVFVILRKVPIFENNMAATWIVTFAVSLLSTRFLADFYFIQNVLTPYTVLGVVLTAGLPLILFFIFVESFKSGILRRILWIFFFIVFVGIWASRYSDVGPFSWIYFFTALIALIFFFADGTIRRIMVKEQMRQLDMNRRSDYEREIKRQMTEAEQDLRKNIINTNQYTHIMKDLRKKLVAVRRL